MQQITILSKKEANFIERIDKECMVSAINSSLIQNSESDKEFKGSKLRNIKYIKA